MGDSFYPIGTINIGYRLKEYSCIMDFVFDDVRHVEITIRVYIERYSELRSFNKHEDGAVDRYRDKGS